MPPVKRDDTPEASLSTNPAERLVDAIALPIGRWDRDARLLFCNAPYCQWAGRPSDALVGSTLVELYGAEAWARSPALTLPPPSRAVPCATSAA